MLGLHFTSALMECNCGVCVYLKEDQIANRNGPGSEVIKLFSCSTQLSMKC